MLLPIGTSFAPTVRVYNLHDVWSESALERKKKQQDEVAVRIREAFKRKKRKYIGLLPIRGTPPLSKIKMRVKWHTFYEGNIRF